MPRPDWVDDTATIPDRARLWRGISSHHIKSQNDPPSLQALVTGEVSVNIAEETTYAEVVAKGHREDHSWRLWEFTARDVRNVGCIVDRDPLPDDPSHAVVLRGDSPGKRLKESQAKRIIQNGRWADP